MTGALLFWVALKLWPNDEHLIRRRLRTVAELASIRPKDSPLVRLANGNRVAELFTPDVVAHIEDVEIAVNDRNDLREAILASRAGLHEAEIRLADVHIRFPPGKSPATVYLTAIARINGATNAFARDLKLTMRKVERQWFIARVESVSMAQ